MKLDESSNTMITPTNQSPPSLHMPRSSKLTRKASSTSQIYRRRPNFSTSTNELLAQHAPSNFSVPLLTGAMQDFFQATKIMEDEIMLPSRLRDMPVDEVVLDNGIQPNNWHELYGFVRDMRNQLTRSRPFAEQDEHRNHSLEFKDTNDDEGILVASQDVAGVGADSSASSTVSSDEFERSITSSSSTNVHAFETIKDELKFHYFGLLSSLDNLTNMANRVTEKYREDSTFQISK